MLKKINNEIDEFTKNIKESKGCDEMLSYLNSSYTSSIKLLMFASATLSMYFKLMLFFVMASGALLLSCLIGALPLSITLFFATFILSLILVLLFITNYRKVLSDCIINVKNTMDKS